MTTPQTQATVLQRGWRSHAWHPAGVSPSPAAAVAIPRPAPRRERRALDRWSRAIRGVSITLFALSLVALALQASVRGFEARGASMEPAIKNGENLIVNHLAYAQIDFGLLDWAPLINPDGHWASPARGHIIVFHSPVENSDLVKRVIALPGERVEIKRGRVHVDGKLLIEPYAAGVTTCDEICTWDVPDGEYFVLGDNRANSRDSREGWTVPRSSIIGRKLLTY